MLFLSCFYFNIDSFTVISYSIPETPSILPEAIDEEKIWPCVQWVPEGMAFFIEFYAVQNCSSTRAMIINFGCLYPNALRCQKAASIGCSSVSGLQLRVLPKPKIK